MRKLIVIVLAVILMAANVYAVTVRELADSKLEIDHKMEIAGLLSLGQVAAADSAFNLAMVELTKAEALALQKKMQQQAASDFQAMVIAYVRPISSIPAVLDSLPKFFAAKKLDTNQQQLVVKMLAERYSLGCGFDRMSPQQRIAMMRGNYNNARQFRTDVRAEIANSGEIRKLQTSSERLAHDYGIMSGELAQLTTTVNGLDSRLTTAEAEIDTLNAGLAAVQKAVEENGFNISAAFSVLRHAEVGKKPNKDAQRLISQYGQK